MTSQFYNCTRLNVTPATNNQKFPFIFQPLGMVLYWSWSGPPCGSLTRVTSDRQHHLRLGPPDGVRVVTGFDLPQNSNFYSQQNMYVKSEMPSTLKKHVLLGDRFLRVQLCFSERNRIQYNSPHLGRPPGVLPSALFGTMKTIL